MKISALKLLPKVIISTKKYVKPTSMKIPIKFIEAHGSKLEQLMCDKYEFSRIVSLEKFYENLINKGFGVFHNPGLKCAFGEKIKKSNITLEELKKIMRETRTANEIEKGKEYSFEFINLTNPTKNEFLYNGVQITRPLEFKEAELVMKKRYSAEEISAFLKLRDSSRHIGIEDADVILKNKMNENTMNRYLTIRQQHDVETNRALYASYLEGTDVQTTPQKIINQFTRLNGKQITYQSSTGKTIEYTLLPEDAAHCAKYGFDETQLQRFAKLRNEYYAKESVRKSGVDTKYTIEDICKWIEKDAKDSEIFFYNYYLNNPEIFCRGNWDNSFAGLLKTRHIMSVYDDILNKFSALPRNISRDRDIFDFCKKYINDLPKDKLTKEDIDFIKEISAREYIPEKENGLKMLTDISTFFDFNIRTQKQKAILKELTKIGVSDALEVASNEELYNVIKKLASEQSELGIKELYALSKRVDLTKFNMLPILNNMAAKWQKVCTGEEAEIGKIFDNARNMLKTNRNIITNITEENISEIMQIGVSSGKYGKALKLQKNGNLIFNDGQNSFRAAVQKVDIEGKSAIIIKDLAPNGGYYIAHNGAVTKLNNLRQIDKDRLTLSLFGFDKYSLSQRKIYADAAERFPVRIIDNNSECIIGKGIPELEIKPISILGGNKTNHQFVSYYQQVLKTLKNNGELTVQNILRIMPRFSALQINPYTTSKNGKMLYSISSEWISKDGVKWQLRTHSTDLGHYTNSGTNAENSDWIFRIGHEENGIAKFFEWNEAEKKFVDTGDFTGQASHIQIPNLPFESGNLLNNIHFQNIMRQISTNIT